MGVIIEDIKFYNKFSGVTTDYLIGNIGDKIQVEVSCRMEEWALNVGQAYNNSKVIVIVPIAFEAGEVVNTDLIWAKNPTAFEEFRVGDIIQVSGSQTAANNNLWEIYEKISDNKIRCSASGHGGILSSSFMIDGGYVSIATPFTAIKYRWNMIGNSESDTFLNKLDGQLNQMRLGGLTASNQSMIIDDPKTNNYGFGFAKTNGGIANFSQKFVITHHTKISPLFQAGQEFDLEDGIAPSHFLSAECLKYIVSVDIARNENDPNFIKTIDFSANDGNTGWFDQVFNGGTPRYSVDDVRYIRQDLSSISSIELTENAQSVEIDITSLDSKFLAGTTDVPTPDGTQFTLNFCVLPKDVEDYTFNDKTIIENFYFDYAFVPISDGTSIYAGDNVGTDEQIFLNVKGTVNSPTSMTVTANLDLGANAVADLTAKGFNYLIWVSVQDHLLDTEESDRVAVKSDKQPFFIDLTDDGMITQTTKFLRHYESDAETEGTTSLVARVEDDVLSYTQFPIDRLGRELDNIAINSVTIEPIMKKTDGSVFELETFTQSFDGTLVVGDAQFIDTTIDRAFKMPDGDQRKQIKIKRRIDLDTTDLRYYEVYYPFLMRWEDWEPLGGVHSDFFDVNEPNNGYNHDWHRYTTFPDWDMYFRFTINASKNGEPLVYQTDTFIDTYTHLEDTEWINESITPVDAETLLSLGGLLKSPTKIIASKEYSGASVPATADDVEWRFNIEVSGQGGVPDTRFLSSVYDWTQFSWFKSLDATNKIKKFKSGNVFTAECLIDFNKLPANPNLKVVARVYDESALAPVTFCILQEDLEEIEQENAVDCIEIEHT